MDILKVASLSIVETYTFHLFNQGTISFFREVFWPLFIIQYVILKIYWIWIYPPMASPLRSLPGPSYAQFLIGQTYSQIKASSPTSIALTWMRKFPDADLIRYVAPGNQELVLVNSPRAFREVTFTHAYAFAKPRFLKRLVGDMVGGGLFFAEGEVHRKQKKLLAGPFLNSNVRHLLPVFELKADELSSSLGAEFENSETGTIEISSLISKTALDIIGQAILGLELDGHPFASELGPCYHTIFSSTTMSRVMLVLNAWVPIRRLLPMRTNREYVNANTKIKQILKKHVQQQVHEIRSLQSEGSRPSNKDLLALIIQEQLKRCGECAEDEIVDHLRTFLAAGLETVGTTLMWAFHALASHQDVQDCLRSEINALNYGKPNGLKYSDICNMEFLDHFVKEVLRCYPPSTCTMREAIHDISICGQLIPSGTTVLMFPVMPQSNCTIWGRDPEKFDPDRWKALPPSARDGYAFQAFNTGARACLGKSFALLEVKVLVMKLVARWRFCHVSKPVVLQKIGLLFKPANGLELKIEPAFTA
ncbi:cytochrome P450, variant [Blastomyces dermatitidis ER-3]|uniref:Cytochrome P450 n=2 Tax=Ajellomyces dermatitidis TaxID=5039 RepID=F2T8P6_AJEDA|nr:cytochrome P450 [Blastomyces dermatitidis ER-3]XP_045279853.1 cytochrome P450, variant [Blastomyces dermatitidis ER-3]EGE79609.2 cytochrome P450 [Blastomyces dermatitidis ATCC 18188]EQL34249.1 hypothetical protein BDFG_03915 [Blastomyces dermatitidis ATCC 26199]EQL34250.1 hypothetical protein, variant [Blastomyces dermatitidis ATCC 26199]KMW67064.1 cytochrome P450, variant [Blastomyces dermatitidis ATCC 18188]OAT00125.1 cytochrome P450 [Blastomyces dermatitidis ER-3]